MTIQSGSPASTDVQETSRAIDTSEFLTRIAEKLRAKSGSDLPLSCFIEQVKLQLAGGKSPEQLQNEAAAANSNMPGQLSDTYKAWAMPD
ncbi:hypothetical protein RLEG12_25155 [Rhizobium leguminosarum bv. trifolii CB782]|uniref:Uncharacterized protein n=1 Tax=Rhizobium hidalgonense TaxID=1538159 RepID=A0A2A6KC32_9HYPH|nr:MULTISPECIES: hypothetical protein [Rhizobium]AHG46325.1 hypothetical protein RLEG12_25155 [Rhizobium leguminosarum bv. trifolii CB782]EJC77251.1 hypothetical protein Rleg10DRAFT_5950 [Rhizobium leguminosarum bv. trifolii WSM2012]MDR9772284.1 hypothetical protein [Rhizobium hidalgonense]MDR9804996.1 hypothetical protein [Rhizobium hidalgonense]MDR9811529.1 hypothetical protein [Rhizobium hidalgonense]